MLCFALAFFVCALLARIPAKRLLCVLAPVFALAAFALVFALVANCTLEGLSDGLFVAVRMIILVAASLLVCFSSQPTQLLDAFIWFIAPLRVFHVPVEQIAFTLALALRFIPQVADEYEQVRRAQIARGGIYANLSLRRKVQVAMASFSAVLIGLFRHAEALASAMDARCFSSARD